MATGSTCQCMRARVSELDSLRVSLAVWRMRMRSKFKLNTRFLHDAVYTRAPPSERLLAQRACFHNMSASFRLAVASANCQDVVKVM
jgi:hypothetical protein